LWDDEIDVVFNAARNPNLHVRVPKRSYRDWLEPDELLSLLDAAELIDQPTPLRRSSRRCRLAGCSTNSE
jgi:hypothetical protein